MRDEEGSPLWSVGDGQTTVKQPVWCDGPGLVMTLILVNFALFQDSGSAAAGSPHRLD